MDITADQWDHLFQSFPGPLAIVLPDHKFSRCNRAYCELVGYSEGELRQRKWQSITHPDDLEGDESGAAQVASEVGRDSYVMDKRYLSRRGHIIQVRLFVCAIREQTEGRRFKGFFVCAIGQPDSLPTLPSAGQNESPSIIKWAIKHPKDATIVGLGTALLLGKDTIADIIKFYLSN